MTFIDHNSTR